MVSSGYDESANNVLMNSVLFGIFAKKLINFEVFVMKAASFRKYCGQYNQTAR
jgi:hypothetical protein